MAAGGKTTPTTEETRALVLKLSRGGASRRECADAAGIAIATVALIRRKADFKRPPRPRAVTKRAIFAGMTTEQLVKLRCIATYLRVSRSAVVRLLIEEKHELIARIQNR